MGMRRLMLRGRQQAGIDLNAPSDLRMIYGGSQKNGNLLPIAFAIGFHPADAIAALSMTPPTDELALIGPIRGEPLPVVKCITSDIRVPADAEYIIEGYLDADGWNEPEGPYGEYVGYYGHLKQNPVFHLTAITHREDAVFQTATIGGRNMATTDTAQLCALRTEQAIWAALENAVREPVAVYCPPATGGMYNARISINQRMPGEARNAIAAADIVVVRFGDKYKQWNAAFDAGYAAALGKSLIIMHGPGHQHALKEVDAAALAVTETPEQVVHILRYVLEGTLP